MPPGQIVDIGGGASTLVDRHLDHGFERFTVLDVSRRALDDVVVRLGDRASQVTFVCRNVLDWEPAETYAVWHDRAVFHFLTEPKDRDRYLALATRTVAVGGVVVLGAFAPHGPTQCSGLPVAHYEAADLADLFGPSFELEHFEHDEHCTPAGITQPFTWVILRRRDWYPRSAASR
jgi:hypothetical protein